MTLFWPTPHSRFNTANDDLLQVIMIDILASRLLNDTCIIRAHSKNLQLSMIPNNVIQSVVKNVLWINGNPNLYYNQLCYGHPATIQEGSF